MLCRGVGLAPSGRAAGLKLLRHGAVLRHRGAVRPRRDRLPRRLRQGAGPGNARSPPRPASRCPGTAARATKRKPATLGRSMSSTSGREQRPAHQSGPHRSKIAASPALSVLHDVHSPDCFHRAAVKVPLVDPPLRDGYKLIAVVGFGDLVEACRLQQLTMSPPTSDSRRAVTRDQPALAHGQAWRGVDGEEGGPATRSKKSGARSQHGELRAQSSQHVGVNDGIKAPLSERKPHRAAAHGGGQVGGVGLCACFVLWTPGGGQDGRRGQTWSDRDL